MKGIGKEIDMKLVSIIVIAYNSADTIVETLESIKKQTYPNIELIITDDCSLDCTLEVVKLWINQNQRVFAKLKIVTTEKNTGLPSNINRALIRASGEYVKIIAADDYMAPNAIEEYISFCELNPKTIPIAKVHLFSEENAELSTVQKYCNDCYLFAKKEFKEQYRMLLIKNRIVAPSASFYPMEVVKKLGGYEEKYRLFEDYPMNIRIMHMGYRCGFIDKELVFYRISRQSVTSSQQLQLKKTEAKFFFQQRLWYMVLAGMGWEAVKQSKYWIKIILQK